MQTKRTTECGQALIIDYPGLWVVLHPEDGIKRDLEETKLWNRMEDVLTIKTGFNVQSSGPHKPAIIFVAGVWSYQKKEA